MKLNQNVLSPYNNFNKVDATTIQVPVSNANDTQLYAAEYLLDYYLRRSRMPDKDIDSKLHYLDRKIEATRKTISSWESYRISAVATGEEELRQKLGSLQPNTGLVINSLESASVTVNNQSYSRGDIIFKDINNQQHHIPSYSGGYYYPTAIIPSTGENSGSYILSYAYATSAPTIDSNDSLSGSPLEAPAQTINITFTPATESGSYGYRGVISMNSSLPEGIELFDDMQPVVAWYLTTDKTSSKGERVYFDEEYTITDGTIQCRNDTSFESLWVEVR